MAHAPYIEPLPLICPAQVERGRREARTLCISIEGLECASELQTALTTHSSAMTNLYRELHQLTSQEVNDQSKYQVLFDQGNQLPKLVQNQEEGGQHHENGSP